MVVAVILGCFAILWPKIFYPMFFGVSNFDARKGILFSSLSIQFQPSYTIYTVFSSEAFRGDRPPHLHGIPTGENGKPFHGQELKRTIDKELRVSFAIIGFNSSQVDIFFAGMFFFQPGPVPGMRPSMGGPGMQPHVQQKAQGGGTMGIFMPIYTVGIVIFFVYTVLKVLFDILHVEHFGT